MPIRVKDTRFNNFYEFPDGTPPEQMEQALGTIRQGLEAPRQPQPGGWAQSLAGVLQGATQQQPQTGSMLPSWGAKDVMGLTPDQVQQIAGMVMGDAKARRDAASQALESEKARASEMKAMQMRLQNDQAERDLRERMGRAEMTQRQGMHESDIASRETLAEADRTAAMDRLDQQFRNQQTLQNERMLGQQTLAGIRARGGGGGGGGGAATTATPAQGQAYDDAGKFAREVFGTSTPSSISKVFDDDPGLAKAFLEAYPNAPMIYRQMAQRYVAEAEATQAAQSAAADAEKSSKPGVFGSMWNWLTSEKPVDLSDVKQDSSAGVGANAQLGSSRPGTNLLSPRAAKQYPNAEDLPAPPDKLEDWVIGQVYRSGDNQFLMRDPVQGVIKVRPPDREYRR